MRKKIIILGLFSLVGLAACTTTNEAISNKTDMTAETLLEKIQDAIDPNNELDNISTLECKATRIIVEHNDPNKKIQNYAFCFSHKNPKVFDLNIETIVSKGQKRDEDEVNILIRNNELEITKNGKDVDELEMDQTILNKLKEHALEFKLRIFFGLFAEPLNLKLDNKKYKIGGRRCYKLTDTLTINLFDNSNEIIYYVDCNNFLIRKMSTHYFDISNISYKEIDNIKMMYKYKMLKKLEGDKIEYVKVTDFRVNDHLDVAKYLEEFNL